MALRLIEMLIPEEGREKAEGVLKERDSVLDFWYDWVSEKKVSIKVIVTVEKSQSVLDELDDNFSHYEDFRMILSPLEAVVPRPEEEEEEEEGGEEEEEEEETGISREELYEEISSRSRMSKSYLLLMALSAVVASIGILRDDIAVIIGAMVIAPMIGPNMGTSLATTLADPQLGRKSIKASLSGILLVFFIALLAGFFLTVDPDLNFILTRTSPGFADIALAIAAGGAGAISYTRGVSTALIGVMVSIALLPTLVLSGLLLGSGSFALGAGAMLLFLINIICVNLAGVATFLFEGIEPKSWWKADKAKKMSRLAIAIWIALLSLVTFIIVYLRWP